MNQISPYLLLCVCIGSYPLMFAFGFWLRGSGITITREKPGTGLRRGNDPRYGTGK